ncbi:MAG: CheR family methyltransferase [bacterium]
MTQDIPERLIAQFSELITSHLGLFYPKNRWRDLLRNMDTVSKELGFEKVESCVRSLLSSPLTDKKIDVLIRHLTIGETFFFRDSCVFQAVKDTILPELICSRDKRGRNINIWSAGCCTGEEPYSIAMLIDQMIPSWEEWKITVLATDLNAEFLRKAGRGVYTNWSFRNAPLWIKTRYFKNSGDNCFELSPRIRKMVTFSQLNLASKNYSSVLYKAEEMDVIFCRNVLMYFSSELREQIINNFMKILVDGSWLILSPSEVPFINHPGLTPVSFRALFSLEKKQFCIKKRPRFLMLLNMRICKSTHFQLLRLQSQPEKRLPITP